MNSNKEWLNQQLCCLDNPECLIPEMNCVTRDTSVPDWEKFIHFCLIAPVPYKAMVANLGFAILYDILNNRRSDTVCERFYFPEAKLLRRIYKAGRLFFSKETCTNLRDFDIIGFSSYFPLQMLGVPEILEGAGLSAFTKDRGDNTPLVLFGGVTAFNAEPIANMVDIIVLGDGEEVVHHIIDTVKKYKGSQNWKASVKKELCNYQGIYVPEYYEEIFYPKDDLKHPNQLKETRRLIDFAPINPVKACVDLKKHAPLTKMLVSNSEGSEMSCGSLLIAEGCSNRCFFCNGSFTSAPYRERTLEQVKKGFEDLILNTGAFACTPYSFNLSDFSCVNHLVKWLLESEDRKVSMSSQRIDYFSEDFAKIARFSGNKSITLAIEAGGERMRRVINKNLTEEEILKAFETAFKVGFSNIKIYMIANLPFETDADRYAIVPLIKKIHQLKLKHGAKTRIRISYTPFQAKNQTPFQWAQTLAIDKVTGLPIFEKNLEPVIVGVHECDVKFRIGTNSDLSCINQCLTLGDRRMSNVIYNVYKSKTLVYRGGMSIGKNPILAFQKILRSNGLDYNDFLREKAEDEVFAWDHINMGISKDFLLNAWRTAKYQNLKNEAGQIREFAENPFDKYFSDDKTAGGKRKGGGIPPCWVKCTHCGCCEKDSQVQHISMPNHSLDLQNISETLHLEKHHIKHLMLLQIYVYEPYRYVHGSKIKMHLRRAALRAGLPILNEFSLASDTIVFQNWLEGIDYAECLVYDRPALSESQMIEILNKELWNMEIVSIQFIDSTKKILRGVYDSVYYQVAVPKFKSIEWGIARAIASYDQKNQFIIEIKIKGSKRDSLEIISHDIKKDRVSNIWLEEFQDKDILCMHLMSNISPYDVMPFLFSTSKRNCLKYAAKRIDYYIKKQQDELDMFSDVCTVCNKEVEHNLFDSVVTESKCIRHSNQANDTESTNLQNLLKRRTCAEYVLPFTREVP